MLAERFVDAVIRSVLDAQIAFYRDALKPAEGATDPYWIAASTFHARLSPKDQELVLRMMQQSAIDALSGIFGVLDGSTTLEPGFGDFTLETKGETLNGDLQDLFLERMEEREEG